MSEISEQLRLDDPRTVLHWYDFLCPFCYVGQYRTAIPGRIRNFSKPNQIEFGRLLDREVRSHHLGGHAPTDPGRSTIHPLATRVVEVRPGMLGSW
jgi:hypothetical protein